MYNAAHYLEMLLALLPQGLIWPKDPDSNLAQLLHARAEGLAGVDARSGDLVSESDPRRAFELLEAWEKDFGLPDECSGLTQTLAERRLAVHAKDSEKGGQSRAYFKSLALAHGYEIEITEPKPFVAGAARAGWPVNTTAVRHWWQVSGLDTPPVYRMRAGAWTSGNSIAAFGSRDMECVLSARQPAHGRLLFSYGEE